MKQTERSDTARGLGASEEQETHLLLRLPLPSSYRAAAPTCRQLGSSQRLYPKAKPSP